MDIGPARRIIEVEPVVLPLPGEAPDLEPAPPEREPAPSDPGTPETAERS